MLDGPLGQLISTFGSVTVLHPDGTAVAGAPGMALGDGDSVVTADGALAGLAAGSSLAISLGSGSRLRLAEGGNALALDAGSAVVSAEPDGGSPVVRVQTPAGPVFVRITSAQAGLEVHENGRLSAVLLAPPFVDGGGMLVTAGYGAGFLATAFRSLLFAPDQETLLTSDDADPGDIIDQFRFPLAHLPKLSGFEETHGMDKWFSQMVDNLRMETAAGGESEAVSETPPAFPLRPAEVSESPAPTPAEDGRAAAIFEIEPVAARTPTPAEHEHRDADRMAAQDVVAEAVALNEPPVAFPDTVSTDEDTQISGILNAADADGDALSFAVVPGQEPANGTVTIAADGSYTYVPAADFFGTDSFTYQVDDGRGGLATAVVTVTVGPVQDAPTAEPDTAEMDKNTTLALSADTLLANDNDVDGDALSVIGVANAVNGSVRLMPDGTVLFTPDRDFSGTASFDYVVSDSAGATDTATVRVDVHNIVRGTEGDDTLLGTADGETVLGLGGDDDIDGQGGADALYGGDGDDRLTFDSDDTVVDGGAGFDEAIADDTGGVALDLAAGNIEQATGDSGPDVLDADEASYAVNLAGSDGDDVLRGGAGDDQLDGGKGQDVISGGGGIDIIDGGEGNDALSGGAGADRFVFDTKSGSDVISDFEVGDSLRFEGAKFDSANLNVDQAGGDVVITFDKVKDFDVTLSNVDLNQQSYTVTQEPDAVVVTFDEKD